MRCRGLCYRADPPYCRGYVRDLPYVKSVNFAHAALLGYLILALYRCFLPIFLSNEAP